VKGTRFADRPGDGDRHAYAVVPLGRGGVAGPTAPAVDAAPAATPYGAEQDIASAWGALIPERAGSRGPAHQLCRGSRVSSEHSNGRIICRVHSGLQFQIMRFSSKAERSRRAAQLSRAKGVHRGRWSGDLLFTAGAKAVHGPWRWWAVGGKATYAISAQWPKHTAKALAGWWKYRMPSRP
jgi:hypothetical protein